MKSCRWFFSLFAAGLLSATPSLSHAQWRPPLPSTVVDAAGKFVGYLSTNLETVTMNANGFPVVLPVGPAGFRLIPFQTYGLYFDNASCTGQSTCCMTTPSPRRRGLDFLTTLKRSSAKT